MRKNVLMYLAVAAFLVSCSKAEVDPISDSGQVKLSGVLNTGAGTRVGENEGVIRNDETDTDKPYKNLDLSIFRANQTYGSVYTSKFTGVFLKTGEIEMDPLQYYLIDGSKTSKFIAVYPQVTDDKYNEENKTLEFTIDGNTDIIASQVVEGRKDAKITIPMEFNHLLTQVQVSVAAENSADAATISEGWGKVTEITISGKEGTAQVTLPDPFTTIAGAVVAPITEKTSTGNLKLSSEYNSTDGGLTIPIDGSADYFGYAMFVPITSAALELNITTTLGGTKRNSILSLTLEAGNAYAITIKLKKTGEVEIEGGGDGTGKTGATLVPWVDPSGEPKQTAIGENDI
jgi:hypothetical protein